LPELEEIRRSHSGDKLGVLAISLEDEPERVKNILESMQWGGESAIGDDNLMDVVGMKKVPVTLFVDASGILRTAVTGLRERDFLEKRTVELLRLSSR
jgi:hypothetical protein